MALGSASAQVATGTYPYGTFDNKGFDTINVGNLNVNFGIPIFSKRGRGLLPFQFGLTYDSSIYTPVTTGTTTAWQPSLLWGWTNSDLAIAGQLDFASNPGTCNSTGGTVSVDQYDFVYYDTHGRPHFFDGSISDCQDDPDTAPFTNSSGDGYTLTVSGINSFSLTDSTGKAISPTIAANTTTASMTDEADNQITVDASGNVTDTTGTVVLRVSGSGNASSPTVYTYPVWLSPTSSTTSAHATVHYNSYNIATAFGCSGVSEYTQTGASLIDSIQLADGEQYTFSYEPTPGSPSTITGRLQSVTLPTGGTISYTYTGGSNGIVCADGGTAGLQRSITGSTWTYTRTPGTTLNNSHTDVTDGMSPANHASYDFIADTIDDPTHAYYLGHSIQYSGSGTTPLLETTACYKEYILNPGAHFPHAVCSSTVLGWPLYVGPTSITFDGIATMASETDFDQNGQYLGSQTWDFGTTLAGVGALPQSLTSYNAVVPPAQDAGTDVVNGGSYVGTASSGETWDYYGGLGVTTTTSGLPQHAGITTATRSQLLYEVWPDLDGTVPVSTVTSMKYLYDDAGQLRSSIDLKGNTTTYTYDTATDTFPKQITSPTVGGVTQTVQYDYDIASGALKSSTDQNGNTTYYTYDNMLRPLTISSPDGGLVTNTYSIAGTGSSTSSYQLHSSGVSIPPTVTNLDPMGRTSSTVNSTGARVDYSYDGNGNIASVSLPYFGTPAGSTTYTYDALNRQRVITESDGSQIKSDPLGNTVTVTDEAGKQRKLVYDGAGRISQVFEPDSNGNFTVETDYAYGQNATTTAPFTYQTVITQKGGSSNPLDWRVRIFTYDRGTRLLSQQTPEAGTKTYTYSGNSSGCSGSVMLPCSKTDENHSIWNYTYDALNRPTGTSYSGYSPAAAVTSAVSYLYDQTSYNGLSITNGKGQRTGMTNGSGATAWSFDSMGRQISTSQTIAGVTKQANYTYNLDGSISTLQDFSGTTLRYTYDSNASLSGIAVGTSHGPFSYASSATYNAAGQLTSLVHQQHPPRFGGLGGNPTYVRSFTYNSRLQPWLIETLDAGLNTIQSLSYGYGSTGHNNGNISTIVNNMDTTGTRTQNFLYDNLNRLQQASDGGTWGEQYTYDNWGNLYQRTRMPGFSGGDNWPIGTPTLPNIHNQLQDVGLTYDPTGALTNNASTGISYTYDAEGRIQYAGNALYTYDGDGNRVSKTVSGTTTLYWPTIVGISDESDSTGTYFGKQIYFAGLQIYSEDIAGNGKYLFQDHLGSTRITGDAANTVQDDIDYLPFGEITTNYASGSDNHYLFTGDEADTESQTNYATFRNLDGLFARFNRPDPYDGSYDPTNPQSFNRYAYVMNNPMVATDPSGLLVIPTVQLDPCQLFSAFCSESKTDDSYNGGGWGGVGPYDAFRGGSGNVNGTYFVLAGLSANGSGAGTSPNYNQLQTVVLLQQAYCSATAGRLQGLRNIYNNSTGKYDFGWIPSYAHVTFNYAGNIMDANQMGNFIAGFEAAAYDKKYWLTTGGGNATYGVFAGGLYYHLSGRTHAKNDPLDNTGIPDIAKGTVAGLRFKAGPC